MLNVNKGSKQPPVRLPALQGKPTDELIRQLVRTLQQNPGRTVVLPWLPGGDTEPMCLMVNQQAAKLDLIKKDTVAYAGDPEWVLYNGPEPEGQPIWNHTTSDLSFILDRLLSETKFKGFDDYQAMTPGIPVFPQAPPIAQLQVAPQQPIFLQSVFQKPTADAAAANPAGAGADAAWGMNVSGNLRDVDMTSVLQSINLCKMAGKLEVNDTLKSAELYFDEGILVHAVGQQSILDENSRYNGDGVLLDLLTWDQGSFKFHSGLKTNERTVARRLEAMLMEGVALRDYSRALALLGFRTDTTLVRAQPQLTEAQFEQILQQGAPLDLGTQKAVYLQIGNGASTDQILTRFPLPKTVWLPIIFNLVNLQIIKLAEGTAVPQAPRAASAVQLDYAAMEMAFHELLRPETSMLSYPLFLWFLTQELARYKKSGMPFSVAIFELKQRRNGVAELLSNEALKQLGAILEQGMQDELVYMSHFGIVDFAMLLPCSIGAEAEQIGERLLELLRTIELDGVDPQQLQFAIGIACVPDDCEDIETLLNLAVQRRRQLC